MSGCPGLSSNPAHLSASDEECHVFEKPGPMKGGIGMKFAKMNVVPALPRVAAVAVQERGSKFDRMLMLTLLSSVEPQTLAANWNAMSLWAPRVVPVLPPTGATGVGS